MQFKIARFSRNAQSIDLSSIQPENLGNSALWIWLLRGRQSHYPALVIEPESLQQIDSTYVQWRRRKLSFFSGCDYFRLSTHPKVRHALVEGLKRHGLTVAASRVTTGNHVLYAELERKLAAFFGADRALLMPNGYVGNLAVAQALAGQFSHVLIDEAAHPSLMDASRAFECPILKFGHRSPTSLKEALHRCGEAARPVLLTDGLFSRDGAAAPLRQYLEVLPQDAMLLVDDAHGAGLLGQNGRGTIEQERISRRRAIQTITLSKAFGVYGGAVIGSGWLRRRILQQSPIFIGSTPLPLPLVNAARQAIAILESDKSFRARLIANTLRVRKGLSEAGLNCPENPGPVIALKCHRLAAIPRVKTALLKADIYPSYIQYPGGPVSGYFRFVISSEHTAAQMHNLTRALKTVAPLLTPLQ